MAAEAGICTCGSRSIGSSSSGGGSSAPREGTAARPQAAAAAARARRARPPPRWLGAAALLGALVLLERGPRGARAQVYNWNGISVKQYNAQQDYERWQKSDEIYSEWAYKNGYLECNDDMQGILAATGMFTCDAMVELVRLNPLAPPLVSLHPARPPSCPLHSLHRPAEAAGLLSQMECSTDFSTLLASIPTNTTVAELCPKSCDNCIEPGFVYEDFAVVKSDAMCAMCAQGGDSLFSWLKVRPPNSPGLALPISAPFLRPSRSRFAPTARLTARVLWAAAPALPGLLLAAHGAQLLPEVGDRLPAPLRAVVRSADCLADGGRRDPLVLPHGGAAPLPPCPSPSWPCPAASAVRHLRPFLGRHRLPLHLRVCLSITASLSSTSACGFVRG